MENSSRNSMHVSMQGKVNPSKAVWGVALVLFGLAFLLKSLNLFDFWYQLGDFWPSVLIVFAVVQLIAKPNSGLAGKFTMLVIGVLLQLDQLDMLNVSIWSIFWPSLLIIWGIQVLLSSRRQKKNHADPQKVDIGKQYDNDTIDCVVVFSGDEVFVTSNNFQGGEILAVFGGVDADLRNAVMPDGSTAIVKMQAVFGGIEVRVPNSWNIVVKKHPFLGAIEDRTHLFRTVHSTSPTLIIDATAVMGGIEINS
jgi:predicted membrane protein